MGGRTDLTTLGLALGLDLWGQGLGFLTFRVVRRMHVEQYDRLVFHWLNSVAARHPVVAKALAWFSVVSPVLFAALFLVCFWAPSRDQDRMRRVVFLSGLAGVVALAAGWPLARLFHRARPFVALPPGQVWVPVPHRPDSSFPSDHTLGSAAFATGMGRSPDRWARWAFLVAGVLVALSRPAMGVHWPSDVVGSWVLGSLCAWAAIRLEPVMQPVMDVVLGAVGRLGARRQR